VTAYIKASVAERGALWEMGNFGNQVWLYANEAAELVGFGTYGTTSRWIWPEDQRNQRVIAHHIPMLGIDRRFRSCPAGLKNERYSAQIVDDLIEVSRSETAPDIVPILTLFVHPENIGAIRLYEGGNGRVDLNPQAESEI